MSTSGLAEQLAHGLVSWFGGLGDLGLVLGILVATVLLTELITNNAAAVLIFPIGLATATQAGIDPHPIAVAIAIGASSSFLTPIGYQTNTMVYGMGGYRFGDFARVGVPLTALMFGPRLSRDAAAHPKDEAWPGASPFRFRTAGFRSPTRAISPRAPSCRCTTSGASSCSSAPRAARSRSSTHTVRTSVPT